MKATNVNYGKPPFRQTNTYPRLYSIIKQLYSVYTSRGIKEENCLGLRNNNALFPYDINNDPPFPLLSLIFCSRPNLSLVNI